MRLPASLLAALIAGSVAISPAITSPARAAGRHTPTLAPANTVIDGPSASIVGLDGLAVARDGTGGVVYLKDVNGLPRVFVSALAGGRFQSPVQVDAGLAGPSSQPVIAAVNGGLLVVAFISGGELYAVVEPSGGAAWQPPTPLFAGARDPSISMSTFGKAYLAFTALSSGVGTIRTAYYYQGVWALGSAPLNAIAGESAGLAAGQQPQVATAGDGTAIVAWGENGHIYTRRVLGTSPSVVYEQADPSSFDGWGEVSAVDPQISTGGDSSYAAVAFDELLSSGGQQQYRVLVNRLQASQFDGPTAADTLSTPGAEGADQPHVALQEYGSGFVTSEGTTSHNVFATAIANNAAPASSAQINAAFEQAAPDAVPATAGTVSTLIAWQQNPGASGPEIRIRYAPDGVDLGPEQVVSTPTLGPTNADLGLFAGGDLSGDAAVAWVQGSGAQKQIVAAQLFQAPGGVTPAVLFHYERSTTPVLSWSPASELWGAPLYVVKVDGVQVAQTYATQVAVPAPLAQGRHSWQVVADNVAGLTNASQAATVFVDTIAPRVTVKLRHSGLTVHATVGYTDAPRGLPRSEASGIRSVQIRWGDGTRTSIGHRATHVYRRHRRFIITVIALDRAGNRSVVTRKLRLTQGSAKAPTRRHR